MTSVLEEYLGLSVTWRDALDRSLGEGHIHKLSTFVDQARAESVVYPTAGQVFTALRLCPLRDVKAVILGQDPYHGAGQAHGLSFSVLEGVKIPPSLRNIYKELKSDLDIDPPPHGDLSAWARRGVLMLNTVLTVRNAEPNSHQKQGWEELTDAVIRAVSAEREHAVFVLWGRPAQKKRALIDARHTRLESAHPSPLSARRGFFESAPFSGINKALSARGQAPIAWNLD